MAATTVAQKTRWMIYGASGYTGTLAARLAKSKGSEAPILAGRSLDKIKPLADELAFEYRIFGLDKPEAIDAALQDVYAVVVAAGPFVYTSKSFVDACLRTKTHYLDITGEWEVFEEVMSRTQEAEEAGVALLPGVGMDVVPADCLASKLKSALPTATHLQMGLFPVGGSISPGTLKTMILALPHKMKVRKDGQIVDSVQPANIFVPWYHPSLGWTHSQGFTWGDISTAYHSTGIPNIAMYMNPSASVSPSANETTENANNTENKTQNDASPPTAPPAPSKTVTWGLATLRWVSSWGVGRWFLNKMVERYVKGPSEHVNANGRVYFTGIAWDERTKQAVECSLTSAEGYQLTALSILEAAQKLRTTHKNIKGSLTPSRAFGVDYILDFENSAWGPLNQKTIDDTFLDDAARKF